MSYELTVSGISFNNQKMFQKKTNNQFKQVTGWWVPDVEVFIIHAYMRNRANLVFKLGSDIRLFGSLNLNTNSGNQLLNMEVCSKINNSRIRSLKQQSTVTELYRGLLNLFL